MEGDVNIVLKQEEKISKILTELETLSSMNQKAFEFSIEMNKKIIKSDDKMNEMITQISNLNKKEKLSNITTVENF